MGFYICMFELHSINDDSPHPSGAEHRHMRIQRGGGGRGKSQVIWVSILCMFE